MLVRAISMTLLACAALVSHGQVRPIPGGGGAGGGAGGGGIIVPPIIIGPGGGGGITTPTAVINSPRGALVGEAVSASAVIVQPAGTTATPPAAVTYQWTVTGARLMTDPRAASVQFVADRAGTVTLSVAMSADGTAFNPTAQLSIFAADAAGSITAPATTAADIPSVTASVPAAQNGDRTFRWLVSGDAAVLTGQGTPSVTLRPGTAGLKELTCNVTLQNLVTVPVRAFLVVTGAGAPTALRIERGTGGGTYPAGSRVDIFADPPAPGYVFDRWTGNTEVLGAAPIAPLLSHTVITMPATPVTLTATYKVAPSWSPTIIQGFNPQTVTAANNQTATVATTLAYHIPNAAAGLVFLLHDAGGGAADWFTRPGQVLLARDLVAAGYGVAALNSVNRNAGTWSPAAVLANNLDALNHVAALDRLVRDGALPADKPVFFLGQAAGATAALRYADLLEVDRPSRPIKGIVLYHSSGLDTLAVTSRVPQFFALSANDETLGAAGTADARDNAQLLVGRGVATATVTNAVSPVHPGRFRALALSTPAFTIADADAVWNAVKGAGFLDPNNYPKATPTAAAVSAALPAAYQARAADVAAELAVAAAAGEFFSDANPRVLNFLNARAADAPVPAPGRLVNLSTRSRITYLGDTLTLGFSLTGTQRATLLIRGIGPTLARFGVSSPLAAPSLQINQQTRVIASNDGWEKAANAAQITTAANSVGAFALQPGALDCAALVQLEPGTYTVTIGALGGTVGDVLAEIYDVSRNGTRLTNLSTLARISEAGELLIPGVVVAGNNPRTLVVRAVGPGLADFGLSADSVLGDPRLSILNGQQTVATNNNWAQAGAAILNAAFPAVGAFPLRAGNDAALLSALAPGSYTLQAGAAPIAAPTPGATPATTPAPNPTGAVLVEVFEVP